MTLIFLLRDKYDILIYDFFSRIVGTCKECAATEDVVAVVGKEYEDMIISSIEHFVCNGIFEECKDDTYRLNLGNEVVKHIEDIIMLLYDDNYKYNLNRDGYSHRISIKGD